MTPDAWINSAATMLFLTGVTVIIIARKRRRTDPTEDNEILRGEHLKVRQRVKELDIDIPPGTRLPEKNERRS